MDLLSIIIAIVVVGLILYAINRWVPMQPNVKNILNIAVIIILCLWLLRGLGFLTFLHNIRI